MANRESQQRKGQQGVLRSFEHAFQGIVSAVRTQRNMRFHVAAAVLVLALSVVAGVSLLELAVLVVVISFVLVVEMLNTAIEFAVDLVTKEFRPLAKLAKDIAAGAVLVSSIGAALVGVLILADDVWAWLFGPEDVSRGPILVGVGSLGVIGLLVVAARAFVGPRGAPFSALPSGYTTVAFAGWVAASLAAAGSPQAGLIFVLTLLVVLLVSQGRVVAGAGALYGVTVVAGSLVSIAALQVL